MSTHRTILDRQREISRALDALAAKRDLCPAEQARFDGLTVEFETLETERKRIERTADVGAVRAVLNGGAGRREGGQAQAAYAPHGAELMRRVGDPWAPDAGIVVGSPAERQRAERDTALAALERSGAPDAARERVTRLLDGDADGGDLSKLARWTRLTSDPLYLRAFSKVIRDGDNGHRELTAEELRVWQTVRSEARALSLTDTAGGYLVPFQIDPSVIVTNDGVTSAIRRISRSVIATGDVWHAISSAGISVGFAAEATEASDNSPTFAQPSIAVHKIQGFVPISIEAVEDELNIAQVVGELFVDAVDRLLGEKLVTGTGSGEPFGVVAALDGTASEVAPAVAETFARGDVYAVQNALPARWQPRAQWCANLAVINTLAQFETAAGALQFPEVRQDQLLRKPLNEVSTMDPSFNAAATADNFMLLYGDFSQYCVVSRIGTVVEYIPHLFGPSRRPTGQRGWYMHARIGADVLVDSAFRVLNIATTA